MKRIICLAVVLLIGLGGALVYTYYLENTDNLEVLSPPTTSVEQNQNSNLSSTAVKFSYSDTFYDTDIEVELSAKSDAKIYYTTDGSVPTNKSTLYTEPISVKAKSKVTSTTIKAIAISDEETSDIITKSYVTGKDVLERFDENTLVFVLSADPVDLYDYDKGIAVEGAIRDKWLADEYDGFSEIKPTDPANWNQEGMAGERDMYVEVYDSKGNKLLEQAAGARIAGAYSRAVSQKSWKLIARRIYSPDNGTFHFGFFDEATDSNGELITEFDRIVLRNGANDREFAGIRDEITQELARQAGFLDVQATTPAAVFLNGEYYGFSWLHENFCKGYLQINYGGNKDNFQIIGKTESDAEGDTEQATADFNHVVELAENGLTDNAKFEEFCKLVDLDNLMLYYAMRVYIDDRDWPGNNYKAWRYYPSEDEEVTGKYLDGKWRFLFYDAEFSWGLYSDGYKNATISKLLNGTHPSGKSVILEALLQRDDTKKMFTNTLCDLISGAFNTENVLSVIEEKIAESDAEGMYALSNGLTSDWANAETFANSRNEIRDFAKNRPKVIFRDLRKVLSLEETMYTIKVENSTGLKTNLNTQIATTAQTISGEYFTAFDVPVKTEAFSGYEFDHWEVNGKTYTDKEINITADMVGENGEVVVKAFSKKTVSDQPLYISEVYTTGNADWIKLYNPNNVAVSTKGFYLSDDETILNKWNIPAVTIEPEQSLVIVCKNNKDSTALMKLVTNFSLKEGEVLSLSDSGGKVIGKVVIQDVGENQSQERQPDGTYKAKYVTE